MSKELKHDTRDTRDTREAGPQRELAGPQRELADPVGFTSNGAGDSIEFKQSHDVFDNSLVQAALDALTPKDKERYLAMGEEMYGHVNFADAKALQNTEPPMMEALAYVEDQLRSGLHPSDMDDNEKALLSDHYGPEWYTKWNFVKEDLDDISGLTH